jgi:hypothetical protein
MIAEAEQELQECGEGGAGRPTPGTHRVGQNNEPTKRISRFGWGPVVFDARISGVVTEDLLDAGHAQRREALLDHLALSSAAEAPWSTSSLS